MMNLLLDTHVLVWAESLDDRLGPQTRALLLDPSHTLLVSPVSTLELSRLIALSRLVLRKSLHDWLNGARQHLALVCLVRLCRVLCALCLVPGALCFAKE